MGPFTGADNDDDFEVGEDVTGGGNHYIGQIDIGGVLYPVITGAGSYPVTDASNILVVVPTYLSTPTFPASFDFNPDLVETTYTYCFSAGTRIATEHGETEVQDLAPGDLVRTADGRLEPVRWLGKQTIDHRFARSLTMVRISAGALGHGLPKRDLVLTGDHAVVLDGALVNASALVNGGTISFVPRSDMGDLITVYHVETERHEALLAEGAASESFCDVLGRSKYDNHSAYLETYGTERIIPEMDLPRISAKRQLPPALRLRLGITEETLDDAV
ncbi:Hint domain-containing protein [Antarctobacter sp.]|uniref:Hint domain-containing protein n=1 Tax=Antarctobacter sp. TaxID=1872577 RepID=UPI002B26762C|nr:Hint domain-containing protein [Antarctobacter sp.]